MCDVGVQVREEDGDSRWGKKGHLENVESEAHVDSKICFSKKSDFSSRISI